MQWGQNCWSSQRWEKESLPHHFPKYCYSEICLHCYSYCFIQLPLRKRFYHSSSTCSSHMRKQYFLIPYVSSFYTSLGIFILCSQVPDKQRSTLSCRHSPLLPTLPSLKNTQNLPHGGKKLLFKQLSKAEGILMLLFFQHEVPLKSLKITNNHITHILPTV